MHDLAGRGFSFVVSLDSARRVSRRAIAWRSDDPGVLRSGAVKVAVVDANAPDAPATKMAIVEAADFLRRGALVVFPTETVYGLGACASNVEAVRAVFRAKGRPTTHPLIVHVEDVAMAERMATGPMSASARGLCEAFWPGPLTVIVPRAARLPADVAGGGDTVGVRAPSHPIARALIRALGDGIAAPSANRYQRVSATRAEHVVNAFSGDEVAMLLDGGASEEGIESTVVDCTGETPRVLRLGAISVEQIRAAIGAVVTDAVHEAVAEKAIHAAPGMAAAHYQPRARLHVLSACDLRAAVEHLKPEHEAQHAAALVIGDAMDLRGILVRRMPSEARAYAHALYAALHDLDDAGVEAIYVETPPSGDAWEAIHDRLRRASA